MDDEPGFGDWDEEEAVEEEAPAEEEQAEEETAAVAADAEEEDPWGAVEETAEGEEGEQIPEEQEPQEQESKLFWSKWVRPKSHIYDYNYGYFNNYYSGMVDQITGRTRRLSNDRPLAESWAERSIRMYDQMKKARSQGLTHNDDELLRKIRTSHDDFFRHRHEVSARETGYHNY